MADHERLVPEEPEDAGVPAPEPDAAHIEGARILADEASDFLEPRGFTHDEIVDWAVAYVDAEGSGDVDSFLDWVADQEARPRS